MPWKNFLVISRQASAISWFDLTVLALLLIGGMIYLHDALHWSIGYVGDTQYGDAQFWWSGALHVAQGIFQDNPGKGFRPGYFVLTGLTLPVLGVQFQQFYPYFVLAFLTISGLFYLALRQSLGQWIAMCVVGMLVFNPFTAEWLATSTTDSTGLLLNIAALSCLLLGLNNGLRVRWLVAFGVLFSLATLTRPLVTPFIGVVLLMLLFIPRVSFKKRLAITLCVLIAFCTPTLMWLTAQKLIIDRWAISSNDSSAFYAASDPNIQVWKPDMYDHVKLLAASRYHITPSEVSELQMNDEFWRETIHNYLAYPDYHLKRLLPHIAEIADFSPKSSAHGTDLWQKIFLAAIAFGMLLWLLLQRRWLRAALLAALGITIVLSPSIIMYMTLAGATFALLKRGRDGQLAIFILSLYWLTGVAALYLVGGTWGPPSFSALFALNALGYRLGSQVFFAGDLLAAYFIFCLASFNFLLKPINTSVLNPSHLILRVWHIVSRPNRIAAGLVLGWFTIFLMATAIVYGIGGFTVAQRTYARTHGVEEQYPALNPIISFYQQHTNNNLVEGNGEKGGLDTKALLEPPVNGKADLIFTGTISPFVWNLQAQERAQILVHSQKLIHPYSMGPGFVILDVPQHLVAKNWIGAQGAFIIRELPNNHNVSNLPYYITSYAVRAFVPVTADGQHFAIEKTVWFPLVKNATQLETTGELEFPHTKVNWAVDSGQTPFQRRFFLTPDTKKSASATQLTLDVTGAKGSTTLSFAYALADIPGATHSTQKSYALTISATKKGSAKKRQMLSDHDLMTVAEGGTPLKQVKLSIPADTTTINIVFNKLSPGTGIWIYEFNLRATNFTYRAAKKPTKTL